jgi:hypothetical protein
MTLRLHVGAARAVGRRALSRFFCCNQAAQHSSGSVQHHVQRNISAPILVGRSSNMLYVAHDPAPLLLHYSCCLLLTAS